MKSNSHGQPRSHFGRRNTRLRKDGVGGFFLRNGLNGAKRLNGWNDWNGCSFIHRVLIVRVKHEHVFSPTTHDHGHEHGSLYFPVFWHRQMA